MKKIMCIYKISSIVKPHRFYIGSTSNYSQRKTVHGFRLKNNKHHSKMMQAHYNKYGLEDLKFEILQVVEVSDLLLIAEQYFMDMLKPFFNSSPTAKNTLGIKLRPRSEEHKRKISEATKGKIISEATRQLRRKKLYKYSINGELLNVYNSLTEAMVIEGKSFCISSKRDPTSQGFVWVNNLSKIPDFELLKIRLADAVKTTWKPVLQLDKNGNFISEFESAREAWRQTGVQPSKISTVASGKRQFAGGFIWKYKNLQNVA